MGSSTDNMAVVDPKTLDVYGIENLKVCFHSYFKKLTN